MFIRKVAFDFGMCVYTSFAFCKRHLLENCRNTEKFQSLLYCVDMIKCYFIIFVESLAYRISDIPECLEMFIIIIVIMMIVIMMNGVNTHAHTHTHVYIYIAITIL